MRASTIAFLLIFAGAFGHLRKHDFRHSDQELDGPATQQADALAQQAEKAGRRYQRNRHVLGELEENIRTLQDVTAKAEIELASSIDRHDSPLTIERRRANVRRMHRDLQEVLEGHRRLVLDQERLEGERAALGARMQLARAGMLSEDQEVVEMASEQTRAEPERARPSPLDALSRVHRARR